MSFEYAAEAYRDLKLKINNDQEKRIFDAHLNG